MVEPQADPPPVLTEGTRVAWCGTVVGRSVWRETVARPAEPGPFVLFDGTTVPRLMHVEDLSVVEEEEGHEQS